jgi:hypothetical protein
MKVDSGCSLPLRKNHKLELEVKWYLELEERCKHRWKKEMDLLEQV